MTPVGLYTPRSYMYGSLSVDRDLLLCDNGPCRGPRRALLTLRRPSSSPWPTAAMTTGADPDPEQPAAQVTAGDETIWPPTSREPLLGRTSWPTSRTKRMAGGGARGTMKGGSVSRRINRRIDVALIPLLSLLYLFNGLDRGNVGNAETQGRSPSGCTESTVTYEISVE